MIRWVLCAIYMVMSVAGLTLIKYGSSYSTVKNISIPIIGLGISAYSILGILFYGISFMLYLVVVRLFDIGYIVPIIGGIINIMIIFSALFVLKEQIKINGIIGALVIIVGIVIMNLKIE